MTWSFPLGRILGSEVRVHATFFLLLLWIGLSAYAEGGAAAAVENLIFICALFACVVAHEFGHALMARRYGIKTPDITLLPIGGLARLERMPERAGQEIAVALAGPAVNIVIWVVLTVLFGAQARIDELAAIEDPSLGLLGRLAAVNLFLALFNLIPAFPMDGGRVFRAILSVPLGRVRATRAAARAGQVLAFGFGLLGLMSGNPILLLIAIFIFIAAAAESSDVAMRDAVHGVAAQAAMITEFEALAPGDSLQAASNSLLRTTQAEFPVLDSLGRPLGVLTRADIFQAVSAGGQSRQVGETMHAGLPEIGLGAPLEKALSALYQQGAPAVAVTGPNGAMIGYITRENLGEFLVLSAAPARR
ncbi:MAG: site-2 protease family protein [Rhodobacter sp.]|nr:site-2 protease family protein [Rhodobacter sp.]